MITVATAASVATGAHVWRQRICRMACTWPGKRMCSTVESRNPNSKIYRQKYGQGSARQRSTGTHSPRRKIQATLRLGARKSQGRVISIGTSGREYARCPCGCRCSEVAEGRHTTSSEPPAAPDPPAMSESPVMSALHAELEPPAAVFVAGAVVCAGMDGPASGSSSTVSSAMMSSSGKECKTGPENELRKGESSGPCASAPSIPVKWRLTVPMFD